MITLFVSVKQSTLFHKHENIVGLEAQRKTSQNVVLEYFGIY